MQMNPRSSIDKGASKSAFLFLWGFWQASVSSFAVSSASVRLHDANRQSRVKSNTCWLVQRHVVFVNVWHSDSAILVKMQDCYVIAVECQLFEVPRRRG